MIINENNFFKKIFPLFNHLTLEFSKGGGAAIEIKIYPHPFLNFHTIFSHG